MQIQMRRESLLLLMNTCVGELHTNMSEQAGVAVSDVAANSNFLRYLVMELLSYFGEKPDCYEIISTALVS